MSDERINLEPLSPWPDNGDFESIVQSVAKRAIANRRDRSSYTFQLKSLVKPALALAASVAIVVWIGALAQGKSDEEVVRAKKDPAFELASWAASGTVPPTSEIIRVLGGSDE